MLGEKLSVFEFQRAMADRYVAVEKLGEGSHGDLWKTVDKVTGGFWAIRRLNKKLL